MKSKTRRNSKNSSGKSEKASAPEYIVPREISSALPDMGELKEVGATLVVGHQPVESLAPQDEKLFRSFQSNLLSLISHELRTPLMGILNAVGLLDDEGGDSGISQKELIKMARQNAQRLHRTLTTLLDMASFDSHTFHARLREAELQRIVRKRIEEQRSVFRDHEIAIEQEIESASEHGAHDIVALADPQKLARAVDLCLEAVAFRAKKGTTLKFRISSAPKIRITFSFEIEEGGEVSWERAWLHGMAGFEGGVGSPSSAFAGVMQSEEAFLTRTEEGLGSEFLLIHQIMRLHQGTFDQHRKKNQVRLELEMPQLSSQDALRAVLTSRAYVLSNQTTSVALVLFKLPEGREIDAFRKDVKKLLYRTTDGAYSLKKRKEVAIVMDDYRRDDLPKLIARVENAFGMKLNYATAHCPEDVPDPTLLLDFAQRKFASREPQSADACMAEEDMGEE